MLKGLLEKIKKKLITSKKKSNNNLNITLNKMVIEFPIEQLRKLDFLNSEISLAFRSKNYFEKIFPFYYFRISILKDNNDSINTKYTNAEVIRNVTPSVHIFFLFFILNSILIKNINTHIAHGLNPSINPINNEINGKDTLFALNFIVLPKKFIFLFSLFL
jgi:hypothetical protein